MSTNTAPITRPAIPIKLYGNRRSGHAHRVELLLSLLGLPYELIEVDLKGGEHKTESFLRMNPFGQIPVIDDNGVVVADSHAILVYLAGKYDDGRWLPRDPVGAAGVQRWLAVAAGLIAFGPATARAINAFGKKGDAAEAMARANALFAVMEKLLGASKFLVGNSPSIADLAGYSYIARAPEGNVSLDPYPNLRAWLARIEALPGFVPMASLKIGLAT